MSAERDQDEVVHDPTKKHRHDIGEPDHGAVQTDATTRSIQVLLGLLILLSLGMVAYSAFRAGASRAGDRHDEPTTEVSASSATP